MPEYTSVSLDVGVRESLEQYKQEDETYSDVVRRALSHEGELREKEKKRWEFVNERLNEQSRLLVRMADELGLEKEQIPRTMSEYESWGANDPWSGLTSDEQTTDVHGDEKRARMQAHDEVLGDEHQGRVSQEVEEEIQQRTAEILDETEEQENDGGNLPWEDDN